MKQAAYRTSIIFLCLSIFVFSFKTQKAHAFLPVLLNPWTIGALTALAGAGVSIANNPEAAKAIASDFYNSITNVDIRNSFAVDMTKGSLLVTAAMWTELKGYVSKVLGYAPNTPITYSVPSNVGNITVVGDLNFTSMGLSDRYTLPIQTGYVQYQGVSGGTGGSQYSELAIQFPYSATTTGTLYLQTSRYSKVVGQVITAMIRTQLLEYSGYCQGCTLATTERAYTTGMSDDTRVDMDALGKMDVTINGVLLWSGTKAFTAGTKTTYAHYAYADGWRAGNINTGAQLKGFQYAGTASQKDSVYNLNPDDVIGDNRFTDTSHDLTDRAISVPKDGTGAIIDSPEAWVQNPATTKSDSIAISQPIAGTGEATQTGLLTSIRTGIMTMADAFAHPIGNATDIKWDRLKLSAAGFTTAFPFSLPWDVGRAWDSVFGGMTTGDPPVFTGVIAKQEITLAFPDLIVGWLPWARAVALATFDIALIYSVRKLLGGAS